LPHHRVTAREMASMQIPPHAGRRTPACARPRHAGACAACACSKAGCCSKQAAKPQPHLHPPPPLPSRPPLPRSCWMTTTSTSTSPTAPPGYGPSFWVPTMAWSARPPSCWAWAGPSPPWVPCGWRAWQRWWPARSAWPAVSHGPPPLAPSLAAPPLRHCACHATPLRPPPSHAPAPAAGRRRVHQRGQPEGRGGGGH